MHEIGSEVSRRSFLRGTLGTATAIACGVLPATVAMEELGQAVTSKDAVVGNAGYSELVTEDCQAAPNPKACEDNWVPSPSLALYSGVTAPIWEELSYRGLASITVDILECDERRESPLDVLAHGTTSKTFSGAEIAGGIVSTLLFADAHNVTARGTYNMNGVPLPQAMLGAVLWATARKKGLPVSAATHGIYNSIGLGLLYNRRLFSTT